MSDRQNTKNDMLTQAGILAAAGIVVRIIGLLYRSPLTGIIGDEGNGYYNYAYNCYAIILLISAYSIPSAISKVIAAKLALGEQKNAQRIFHGALLYVAVVSGAFSLFVWFGAGLLTYGHSVSVLRVFAPTILLFGFLGVLRGYFQARRTMVPTSVSQILEQIVNAVVSILAAWLFIRSAEAGADDTARAVRGAIGSALGTGAGVLTAFLFMLAVYLRNRRRYLAEAAPDPDDHPDSTAAVMKLLFLTVTPFILSTFIYNLSTMLNQTLFQRILTGMRAYTESRTAVSYGIFSTKAVVIANIPIALSNALSSAMMPNLSARHARGNKAEAAVLVNRALRVTLFISVPCAAGLMALSRPVMMVLFPQRASLAEASRLLAGIAVTVIFYSISTVTNAVLQAIGRLHAPVVNAAVSLLLQGIVLTVLLVFTPLDNGALVIAMILYSGLICLLNQISLHRYVSLHFDWAGMLKAPLPASLIMAFIARAVYQGASYLLHMVLAGEYLVNLLSLLPAMAAAVSAYALLIVRLGGITGEELSSMPGIRRLAGPLRRMGIL